LEDIRKIHCQSHNLTPQVKKLLYNHANRFLSQLDTIL